ncbi:MAG: N-formylglutamate amidohydrolase [Bdellovibrionales bacterium]|nr:N-formylglutamate amidohydrolase [Bdellovibrionales bacterium]
MSQYLISCEHGGNKIPLRFRGQVRIPKIVLESHRGLDIGALNIAKYLAKESGIPLIYNDMTRLLIDFNRSFKNPNLFSEYSFCLTDDQKKILEKRYSDYRKRVREFIDLHKKVIHLSIHSFTPVFNGDIRNAEVGLLYDPSRSLEKKYSDKLYNTFIVHGLKVRRNYPYKGTSDGLTTSLRKEFGSSYVGIEIEFNQKLVGRQKLTNEIKDVLQDVVAIF